MSNWDDNGNYHEKPRKIKENVRQRFNTLEEAIKYAKNEKYKYLNLQIRRWSDGYKKGSRKTAKV